MSNVNSKLQESKPLTLRKINGPNTEDTIDVVEALRARRDTDGLALDDEVVAEGDLVGV